MVKNSFQQIEIGVYPKDWEVVPLIELVLNHNSGVYKNKKWYGNGVNIIGVSELYEHSKIDGQIFQLVELTKEEKLNHILKEGDLIYGESSLVKTGIGKTLYVTKNGEGTFFAWHTRRYNVKKNVLPEFLYHMLNSFKIRKSIINRSTTTALTGITTKEYFNTEIPLPPYPEQQKIASILTDIENLIKKIENLIQKKKNIQLGIIQELVSGLTRLKGFNEKWITVSLKDCVNILTGKSKSRFVVIDGRYFIMDMGSVSKEGKNISHKHTHHEENILQYGDLVMPKDDIGGGNIIGKTVFIDENDKYVLGDHVYLLRGKKRSIDSKFLSYLINSFKINKEIKKNVVGSAQLGINKKSIEEQIIEIPPSIKEQSAISEIISKTDEEIKYLEKKHAKYTMLRIGMMQKLLTGEIRLT